MIAPVAASQQGAWVVAGERVRAAPEWEWIVQMAQLSPAAHVVGVGGAPGSGARVRASRTCSAGCRVPSPGEAARTCGPCSTPLRTRAGGAVELIAQQKLSALPHTVTHGDLYPSNLLIEERSATRRC